MKRLLLLALLLQQSSTPVINCNTSSPCLLTWDGTNLRGIQPQVWTITTPTQTFTKTLQLAASASPITLVLRNGLLMALGIDYTVNAQTVNFTGQQIQPGDIIQVW